jgi:hypothetical protein
VLWLFGFEPVPKYWACAPVALRTSDAARIHFVIVAPSLVVDRQTITKVVRSLIKLVREDREVASQKVASNSTGFRRDRSWSSTLTQYSMHSAKRYSTSPRSDSELLAQQKRDILSVIDQY